MKNTLLIGGDVAPMPGSRNAFLAACEDPSALLRDGLAELWLSAGARVFNLECPITDREAPIEKCGPNLRAAADCAGGIGALSPTAVALANNHILDQGPDGIFRTIQALLEQGIPAFGAGENAQKADKSYSFSFAGRNVTLWAVCEHEFSAASEQGAGANALEPLTLGDRIRGMKQNCDYLIVLYHGGREYDPYPSPNLQKRCRRMGEWGADLILCQHSHCVGSMENWGDCAIVYGQGNFLFDLDGEPEAFDTGLLISLDFSERGKPALDFVPVGRKEHGAELLHGEKAKALLSSFAARSEELKKPGFVEERYRAYGEAYRERMLKVFLSGNPLLKAVNVLYGRRPSRVYSPETLRAIRNSLECESINELLIQGIKE